MFRFLKRKKKKNEIVENLPKAVEDVETISIVEDYVFERARKLREINYKFAQVFEPKQKLLIWFNGKESKIIGYPRGLRVDLNDYLILYQVRPPSWLDSVTYSLLRILGKHPPLAVIRAPKEIVKFGDETITILAHAFIINEFQEYEAVPLSHDIVDAKLYLALKKENDMLWDLIEILRRRVPEVVEDAMKMNPRIKTYMSTKSKDEVEGTQSEKFGGVEVEFSDPFTRFRGIKL
ncbi:hypothetical protein [Pyrococcus kukulkanii]|uniref:hypothetical protein n=1 Tax=Pyrococcus kukulkanii TaxID=1609559 RepID=UPI0035685A44